MCLFVTILPAEVLPLLYPGTQPGTFGIALLQVGSNSIVARLILQL
ncbi:hypothetical protein OG226_00845 [Streptomyces sp. NBC_01261]|nr:hypothetical protein [Streptomyces sp. NBC_01261]